MMRGCPISVLGGAETGTLTPHAHAYTQQDQILNPRIETEKQIRHAIATEAAKIEVTGEEKE